MKIRIKLSSARWFQIGNNNSLLKNSVDISGKPLPTIVPQSFQVDSLAEGMAQQRLVEIEAARNRALGQAYLVQLPPR